MPKTRGRIIRILDRRTVIINLGSADGVLSDSTFSILAGPEKVVDPETKEELGEVLVVKAKVRASQVFESFTIASSKWTEVRSSYIGRLVGGTGAERVEVDQGELRVVEKDLQPWKAWSEEPVTVGDEVEVWVTAPTAETSQEESDLAGEDNQRPRCDEEAQPEEGETGLDDSQRDDPGA